MFSILNGTKSSIITNDREDINRPRKIEDDIKDIIISLGPRGGINMSTIFPITFPIIKEEEAFANEFCIDSIIMSPVDINCRKLIL